MDGHLRVDRRAQCLLGLQRPLKARAQRQNERPRGAKGTLTTATVVFRIAHKPKQCRT